MNQACEAHHIGGVRCVRFDGGGRTPRMRALRGTGRIDQGGRRLAPDHLERLERYAECMTVRDLLTELQHLPRDLEVLAFEAGCQDYCEREVDFSGDVGYWNCLNARSSAYRTRPRECAAGETPLKTPVAISSAR